MVQPQQQNQGAGKVQSTGVRFVQANIADTSLVTGSSSSTMAPPTQATMETKTHEADSTQTLQARPTVNPFQRRTNTIRSTGLAATTGVLMMGMNTMLSQAPTGATQFVEPLAAPLQDVMVTPMTATNVTLPVPYRTPTTIEPLTTTQDSYVTAQPATTGTTSQLQPTTVMTALTKLRCYHSCSIQEQLYMWHHGGLGYNSLPIPRIRQTLRLQPLVNI